MAKKQKHVNWLEQNIAPDLLESTMFKFNIHIDSNEENVIQVDLTNDADVDYNRLEEQLEDCPQQLVYWGTIYSSLRAYSAVLERRCKARRGVLTKLAVELIKQDNTVARLTADQIKMVIEKDATLNNLEAKYIKVQMHTGKVFNMVQALQMKADNMRSLFGLKKKLDYDS